MIALARARALIAQVRVYCINKARYGIEEVDIQENFCAANNTTHIKLYCPTVSIETEPLAYVYTVKYLGFGLVYSENKKNAEDMLIQLTPSNLTN